MRKITLTLCAALVGSAMFGADTVALKLAWPVGKKLTMRMDSATVNQMVMGEGKSMRQVMAQRMDYSVSFLKKTPEGGVEMETEFLAVKMDMEAGGVKMSFDSAQDKPTAANPFAFMGAMVGKKFTTVLDSKGNVVRTEGVEKAFAGLDSNPMLKEVLKKENLEKMSGCDLFSKCLGNRDVKVGESWSDTWNVDLGSLGKEQTKLNCTYVGMGKRLGRDCAQVDFTGDIGMKLEFGKGSGMEMEIKDGKLKGTNWYAPDLGVVIESAMEQSLKLKMKMPAVEKKGKTQEPGEVNSDLDTKLTVSLLSVKALK